MVLELPPPIQKQDMHRRALGQLIFGSLHAVPTLQKETDLEK